MTDLYEGISHVVELNSNVGTHCDECDAFVDGSEDFAGGVNHYIEHGYRLLHVGSQWGGETNDGPYTVTVAVLGK